MWPACVLGLQALMSRSAVDSGEESSYEPSLIHAWWSSRRPVQITEILYIILQSVFFAPVPSSFQYAYARAEHEGARPLYGSGLSGLLIHWNDSGSARINALALVVRILIIPSP